jgi:glycosyltransferase involved in cell wall biosynthesis
MDVRLYWRGEFPEYLGPLLEALDALPDTDDAPEGEVVFCPDAATFPPPDDAGDSLVAVVPDPEPLFSDDTIEALATSLAAWAQRGAYFIAPTATAASSLRVVLGLPAERVRAVALPLPPDRIPPAASGEGQDLLVVPPATYSTLLNAVRMVRLAGLHPRLLLADPGAEAIVRPGGLANFHGLLAGAEVVTVDDWREEVDRAGAIVTYGTQANEGWMLREALATGLPVVAPQTSHTRDHLTALGAGLYPFSGHNTSASLATAITRALQRTRGNGLQTAAREAVLNESWADAASAVYSVLTESLAPAAAAPAAAGGQNGAASGDARVTGERLSVCVLNPRASEGGGERFMRELVLAMAKHESAPRIKLVTQIKPFQPFDPGTKLLQSAGVEVQTIPAGPGATFDQLAAPEREGFDLLYYSWPHMSDPIYTDTPLVCTWHDLNWKHFDVYDKETKAQIETQTPRWIERATALVHSSNFIRDEMQRYYDVPESLLHVIPLTAGTPSAPATDEERAAVRHRFGLPERFLLSPAGCHLHKNYPVLDAALRALRDQGRPITVVATGEHTDVHYHGPDLLGLGYVSSRELQALYEESDGIVQTTLYEAGSWPMWEANVVGKPAAISRIPSVVEQVQRLGTVAELFNPLDPGDVAGALARLWDGSPATDPQTLAANAAVVASRSWNDVASDYLGLFADVRREASLV